MVYLDGVFSVLRMSFWMGHFQNEKSSEKSYPAIGSVVCFTYVLIRNVDSHAHPRLRVRICISKGKVSTYSPAEGKCGRTMV